MNLETIDGQAPNALEVALLTPELGALPGVGGPYADGDAALSLVADGSYQIDLTGIAPGTVVAVFFDLVAFEGSENATAVIDNVRLTTGEEVPPRLVGDLVIEGGDAQRSMVRTLELTIQGNVASSLDASDFLLVRHDETGDVSIIPTIAFDAATGVVTLTFPDLTGASLADGNHTLTIVASGITTPGGLPLLDANGQPFGSNPSFAFHRYFGDSDGDRDVDFLDTFRFQSSYLTNQAADRYDPRIDREADGDVDALDLFHFMKNHFTVLAAPQPAPEPLKKPPVEDPVERPVVVDRLRPKQDREVGLRSLRHVADEEESQEKPWSPSRGGELADSLRGKELRIKWLWPDLDSLDDDEEVPWF